MACEALIYGYRFTTQTSAYMNDEQLPAKKGIYFSEANSNVRLFEEAIKGARQELDTAIKKAVTDYLKPTDESEFTPDWAY